MLVRAELWCPRFHPAPFSALTSYAVVMLEIFRTIVNFLSVLCNAPIRALRLLQPSHRRVGKEAEIRSEYDEILIPALILVIDGVYVSTSSIQWSAREQTLHWKSSRV